MKRAITELSDCQSDRVTPLAMVLWFFFLHLTRCVKAAVEQAVGWVLSVYNPAGQGTCQTLPNFKFA